MMEVPVPILPVAVDRRSRCREPAPPRISGGEADARPAGPADPPLNRPVQHEPDIGTAIRRLEPVRAVTAVATRWQVRRGGVPGGRAGQRRGPLPPRP